MLEELLILLSLLSVSSIISSSILSAVRSGKEVKTLLFTEENHSALQCLTGNLPDLQYFFICTTTE